MDGRESWLRVGFPRDARETVAPVTPERLAEARAALRMTFLVLAPRRVAALAGALQAAVDDEVARRELQRLGHQWRGTAATVGLGELGLLGGVIERAAAALPYTAQEHACASAAVALVGEYVARSWSERSAGEIAHDPRFRALCPEP